MGWCGPATSPWPARPETIRALRDAGKRLAFVTNNSSETPESYAKKLADIGAQGDAAEVVTSADAVGAADGLEHPGAAGPLRVRDRRTGPHRACREAGVRIDDGADPTACSIVDRRLGSRADLREAPPRDARDPRRRDVRRVEHRRDLPGAGRLVAGMRRDRRRVADVDRRRADGRREAAAADARGRAGTGRRTAGADDRRPHRDRRRSPRKRWAGRAPSCSPARPACRSSRRRRRGRTSCCEASRTSCPTFRIRNCARRPVPTFRRSRSSSTTVVCRPARHASASAARSSRRPTAG